jgi:hypothetical protein
MKKVWLLVILAFLLLIGAWSVMITVAIKNQPQKIEVSPETSSAPAR